MIVGTIALLAMVAGAFPVTYFTALTSYGMTFVGFLFGLAGVALFHQFRNRSIS